MHGTRHVHTVGTNLRTYPDAVDFDLGYAKHIASCDNVYSRYSPHLFHGSFAAFRFRAGHANQGVAITPRLGMH
jgi:hypothetical protein